MMLPSVKINVPLLWVLCVVVFSLESVTSSTPETSMSITVKTNNAARQQTTTAHVATEKNEKAVFGNDTDGSPSTTDGLVIVKTKATEATSISKLLSPTVETTVKGEVQHSHITTVPDSLRRMTEQSHQPPVTSFTDRTKASAATVAEPLPQSTSTTHPETASELTSITSVDASTHRDLIQRLSNNTPSEAEGTASPTSEAALVQDATETKMSTSTVSSYATQSISATTVHDSTSQFPGPAGSKSTLSLTEDPETVASTSTEHSHTSPSISATSILNYTSQFPEPAGSSATSAATHDPVETVASTSTEHSYTSPSASATSTLNSTPHILDLSRSSSTSDDSLNSTAIVVTRPAGILISQAPRNLTVLTVQPTPVITTTPSETSKTSPSNPVQPCNTRATVKQCLIAIASLAALATIFMVSTIVLCTKLSARKYKFSKPQQETEMICISALLPDRTHTYTRQRNPITNGVMVYPLGGDSDEEVGDNLTLSSFLPENV